MRGFSATTVAGWVLCLVGGCWLLLIDDHARAQDPTAASESPADAGAADAAEAPAIVEEALPPEGAPEGPLGGAAFAWQEGPLQAQLGELAQIDLSGDFRFLPANDSRRLLEAMGNITSGDELGIVMPKEGDWFVVFEFSNIGYVKDDDRDALDADAMIEAIRQGTERANEERESRGIPPMNIIGWEQPPRYEPSTNNLEWCIRAECEGEAILNYNTRLLGRNGVMEVNLVVDPQDLPATLPTYGGLLTQYSFTEGNKYGDFRPGDRIAEYGLAALVAGGGLALAAKTGLLAKLWKPIAVAGLAVLAFLRKLFGGGRHSADSSSA